VNPNRDANKIANSWVVRGPDSGSVSGVRDLWNASS
jgi:hypothetical protein